MKESTAQSFNHFLVVNKVNRSSLFSTCSNRGDKQSLLGCFNHCIIKEESSGEHIGSSNTLTSFS